MRQDRHNYKEGEMQDSFFQHWYRVLYDYNMKRFKVKLDFKYSLSC